MRNDGHGGVRARAELVFVEHAPDRVPQAEAVFGGELLRLLHRRAADAARRDVDDALQADRIRLRLRQLQIRDDVLDFGALVVADAADHVVLAVVAAQRFFNLARLRIGAVENRHAPVRILPENFLDRVGDEERFVLGVVARCRR